MRQWRHEPGFLPVVRRFLGSIGRGTVSLLLPPRCPCCDGRVDRSPLPCPRCDRELRILWAEADLLPPVDGLLPALPFVGAARTLIHRMKYKGHLPAAKLLGLLMAGRLVGERPLEGGMLVPIPLHQARRRERGFNQAERLARTIGRSVGWPVRTDLLVRIGWEGSQTSREQEARRAAVAGAFRIRHPPPPGSLFLIDDVWTTGATAEVCRQVLLEAGASPPVRVLVAAQTPVRLTD